MRGLFLPLKLTGGVEITKSFETHISKKSGPDAVPPIRSTFEEMQKLRNALDYNKMQAQINNDYRLAPEFQLQIINYLRYVYLVDNFFKSDFPESKYLKLNFPWTDSFQPKKVKAINHIKYELASCLYNLAICYYSEGIHYAANPGAQEKLKGIAKLRSALWCINEIRQVLPALLTNPNDLPSDLNLSYINLLHNYFIGLTYAALMEVMSADKKNGPEKLASVNKAAAKHFQIAFDIINAMKPCPIPDPTAKALKINLLYNTVMFRSDAYFHMAQIHLAKVDEEIRAGHMGLAVSYLRITKMDFDTMLKNKSDLDLLTAEQKTALLEKNKIIQTNYDNCLLKNQRVYQQPEYSGEQLPEISEEKAQITPIEPKDIKKKLDEERFFEVFLSPEILAIKSEFMNYVSMKMLEIENSLKNANNVKNKLYADGYVNYLLDLQSQSGEKKVEIPPHLKQRIDKFKKNGGVNAYMFTKKNIVETSGLCGKTMQDIKGPLAAEREQDETLRRQFPGQWTRPYSEQVNQEYVLKLKDLEQKFFIAQNTDKDVMKKFDQYQDWMQKFSLPDDQILSLIPRSTDSEFVNQSRSKLGEIAEINRKVTDLIDLDKQRANIRAFTDEFMKTDFMSSFAAIHAGTVDKQQEFDKLLAPYKAKLSQIENQINEAYPLMDAISNQAKEMVAARGDANNSAVKVLEEMNLAITVINDIFNDFQQGVTFYGNLNFHLNTLQKVVQDFCLAREIEKSALLQELQAQKNYSNMNQMNAQPFFQDEALKFNQGQSVFVPQGQHQPQGQNKMPGQQPQNQINQTQMYQPPQQNINQTQMYQPNPQNQINQTQMYNPHQQNQNQGYTNTQMYMPPQQNITQTQAYFPPGQGQTHTQMYNPNQNQQYNPNQGQQQYNNPNSGFSNANATSHMGYMPMPKPDQQPGGQGQFGAFGNVVESTFIPSNQGNPFNNQQGKY